MVNLVKYYFDCLNSALITLFTELDLHQVDVAARQLVTHGHFLLNGRRVDIPSIRLKARRYVNSYDLIAQEADYFKKLDEISPAPSDIPGWLKVNRKKIELTVTGLPTRDDAEPDINEQLIVEYYSR